MDIAKTQQKSAEIPANYSRGCKRLRSTNAGKNIFSIMDEMQVEENRQTEIKVQSALPTNHILPKTRADEK